MPAHWPGQSESRPSGSGKAHYAVECRPKENNTHLFPLFPTGSPQFPPFPILTNLPSRPIVASQHTHRSPSKVFQAALVWRSSMPAGFTSHASEWLGRTPFKPPSLYPADRTPRCFQPSAGMLPLSGQGRRCDNGILK